MSPENDEQPESTAATDQFWDFCAASDTNGIGELLRAGEITPAAISKLLFPAVADGQDPISLGVIRYLLEQPGVGFESLGDVRWWWLIDCKCAERFKLLVEHGLDLREEGHNLLIYNLDNRAVLDFLFDHGIDSNPPYSPDIIYGLKAGEHDDTNQALNRTAVNGDIDTFDYLVSRGADPTRSIALHRATRCEDSIKTTAMISHLVEKYDFDVNATDQPKGLRSVFTSFKDEGSPLRTAIGNKNMAAVRTLLKYGADPSSPYALRAALRWLPEALDALMEAGADLVATREEVAQLKDEDLNRRLGDYLASTAKKEAV